MDKHMHNKIDNILISILFRLLVKLTVCKPYKFTLLDKRKKWVKFSVFSVDTLFNSREKTTNTVITIDYNRILAKLGVYGKLSINVNEIIEEKYQNYELPYELYKKNGIEIKIKGKQSFLRDLYDSIRDPDYGGPMEYGIYCEKSKFTKLKIIGGYDEK